MKTAALLFTFGTLWLQYRAHLPAPALCYTLFTGGLILFILALHSPSSFKKQPQWIKLSCIALTAFLLGYSWAALRAHIRLSDTMPSSSENRDIELTGIITGLPEHLDDGIRFQLIVEEANAPLPHRLQLSWYRNHKASAPLPSLQAGERWRFQVRLKKPHGFVNPDGFDYEAWLLERNIGATGYILHRTPPERIDTGLGNFTATVDRLRDTIRTRFHAALPDAPYAGMLIALTVGDQRAISPAQWETFRRTGITHLVAISGMHITFIAALAGGIAAFFWRKSSRLILWLPTRKIAALAALCAATGYALLAGMGIPVQRALIMLSVAALALLCNREVSPGRILSLALFSVLILDPWAVLSAGFWLSFCAVALILLALKTRTHPPQSRWFNALRLQLIITLGMIPALLILFQSFSIVSPLANAIAIPAVNLLITPLALASALVPADSLLWFTHLLTAQLMQAIEWFAAWPIALWQQAALPWPLIVSSTIAILLLLLPAGTPGKVAAIALLAITFYWQPERPAYGTLHATVLDIGNGLAIHLQTAHYDLLYDTGPPYGKTADAGSRVILPYLTAQGVHRLDRLILSHDDSDHTGGVKSLLTSGIPVTLIQGATPPPDGLFSHQPCEAGESWTWDGVQFQFLHPQAPKQPLKRHHNNDSCVLKITAAGQSLLLLGDIETRAEKKLLAYQAHMLQSEVVVVAHHGGRTSSSTAFIEATQAQHALFSVGYLNRYGHPHPEVWERWMAAGSKPWRTDTQGAIHILLGAGVAPYLTATRMQHPHYWHLH